jgi:hypothetical protein
MSRTVTATEIDNLTRRLVHAGMLDNGAGYRCLMRIYYTIGRPVEDELRRAVATRTHYIAAQERRM